MDNFNIRVHTKNGDNMIWEELLKFIFYSLTIVIIVKYILVKILRRLAESLNLSAKTVGNISGISTSIPELLTICFSATSGLLGASIYNVISSNVINLIQYLASVVVNRNTKMIKQKVIFINLIMVGITIIIPILIYGLDITSNIFLVLIFIILAILFYYINAKVHAKYHISMNLVDEIKIEQEKNKIVNKKFKIILYVFNLLLVSILLFLIGERLSYTLENLCVLFGISQSIIGIMLGFITSIPELITFFEAQKHHNKREKKEEGIIEATNNLLTSNILNLFIIQSIGIILFNILI